MLTYQILENHENITKIDFSTGSGGSCETVGVLQVISYDCGDLIQVV